MTYDPIDALVASLDSDKWCILRTSGSRTLKLHGSLAASGIEAWTPWRTQAKRVPRSKLKTKTRVPILPTFVFVKACHLPSLVAALTDPLSPHPSFSLFQHVGRVPLIADHEIDGLREAAEGETQRRTAFGVIGKPRKFDDGDEVAVPEGAWTGLSGLVEDCDGRFALVCFHGRVRIKISTSILQPVALRGRKPSGGTAAIAA